MRYWDDEKITVTNRPVYILWETKNAELSPSRNGKAFYRLNDLIWHRALRLSSMSTLQNSANNEKSSAKESTVFFKKEMKGKHVLVCRRASAVALPGAVVLFERKHDISAAIESE